MTTSSQSEMHPTAYCIIHGHFYQPPRTNAWLKVVPPQKSARPYHDWNERIYDECYRPNAFSRLLDPFGRIATIYNNYCSMSFNFGPTLFNWIAERHPELVEKIIEADKDSRIRLNGHGNALAQVYNHIIMPLASRRDKMTQLRWASSHFTRIFERQPEGIWLSETACNNETVRCLIETGYRFVILSPQQADSIRPLSDDAPWISVSNGSIQTGRPYRIFPDNNRGTPNAAFLDVFFFDEGLSRAISFENLLTDAHVLGKRLRDHADSLGNESDCTTVIAATDGETFGHHKSFGDMCLAWFFSNCRREFNLMPVNPGYLLEKHPPAWEVHLKNADSEGTSWSCFHGVGRWYRDCGCSTGGYPSWNQAWRTPLRTALTTLQKHLDTIFESFCAHRNIDPWLLRDGYEPYINNATTGNFHAFLCSLNNGKRVPREEVLLLRRFLDAQTNMLYAYTSCGWFFSDISGIETVQNLEYAFRALQLGSQTDVQYTEMKQEFLDFLADAHSNCNKTTGKSIVESTIEPLSRHMALLCFAAAAEYVCSPGRRLLHHRFGFTIKLKELKKKVIRRTEYTWFHITAQSISTDEQYTCFSMISCTSSLSLYCWTLPQHHPDSGPHPHFTPQLWKRHPKMVKLSLADIFEETREIITATLMKRIFKPLMQQNLRSLNRFEQQLFSLSSLNLSLPPHLTWLLIYLFSIEWNRLIVQFTLPHAHTASTTSKLRELFHRCRRFDITIDFSKSTKILEVQIFKELESLSRNLEIGACDRIRSLLHVVDRFGIPIAKNRMEDAFYLLLKGRVTQLYSSWKHSTPKPPDTTTLLLALLQLARRLNFNTDDFIIDFPENEGVLHKPDSRDIFTT